MMMMQSSLNRREVGGMLRVGLAVTVCALCCASAGARPANGPEPARVSPAAFSATLPSIPAEEVRSDPAPQPELLRVPEGGLQPQAAVDARGTVHLVYLKGEPAACDVFYTRLEKGDAAFSTSIRVNSQPGSAIAVGAVRGAQLALGRNGRVYVVWNGSNEAQPRTPGGNPLFYTRMKDAGDGFEPERNMMGSTTLLDGGGSVAADSQGDVYVVWHAQPADGIGPRDEHSREVFLAHSFDGGRTFEPERAINPAGSGACPCCGLKAFCPGPGKLAVLYRSALGDGDRNVTLLLSNDGGKTFTSAILGPWHISFCPMSTMALGSGPNNSLMAMWETKGQVFRATMALAEAESQTAGVPLQRAAGRPIKAIPAAGSEPNRKHPAFAMSGGAHPRLLMAWTEGTAWAKGGSLAWESLDLGTKRFSCGRADGLPVWGGVAVAALGDGDFALVY
jgi:hypothetical protein